MEEKEKIQFIEEIKQLERELYLKRSKLASKEAMEYGATPSHLICTGVRIEEWKEVIKELIALIGLHSSGGNSIEDVRKEREG